MYRTTAERLTTTTRPPRRARSSGNVLVLPLPGNTGLPASARRRAPLRLTRRGRLLRGLLLVLAAVGLVALATASVGTVVARAAPAPATTAGYAAPR